MTGTAVARINRFGVNCRLNDPCRISRFGCCPRPRAVVVRRTTTTVVAERVRPRVVPRALCTNRLCSNCRATLATNTALLNTRTIAGPLARPIGLAGGVLGTNTILGGNGVLGAGYYGGNVLGGNGYYGGGVLGGPGYYGGGVLGGPGFYGQGGVLGGGVAAPLVY